MRIAILGHTGMLGGMVKRYLEGKYEGNDKVEVICIPNRFRVSNDGGVRSDIQYYLGKHRPDYVINCIGAIKPYFKRDSTNIDAIYTNAIFPRELADWCKQEGAIRNEFCRLIHITTDCVYDGEVGCYDEGDEHTAADEYGKSKSLGEPSNCIVLRTSIIGPEWGGNSRSLISWFMKQDEANGYENHMWNGLTTLELAKAIDGVMFKGFVEDGIYHLHSTDVTKYELLKKMAAAFGRDKLKLSKTNGPDDCDRRLRSAKELNKKLGIASINKMLEELAEWVV